MGKKRGFHVVSVQKIAFGAGRLFDVEYKHSKCRYAPVYLTTVYAIDELEAYQKAKSYPTRVG